MGWKNIFSKLVPKEKKFFPMFESSSVNIVKTAELFKMLIGTTDQDAKEELFRDIKDLETKGDEITHTIFDELDTTFITPFDREDVHKLAFTLDDVLDFINGSSQRIKLYKPKIFPRQFTTFSELILEGTREIDKAVKELRKLKKPNEISRAVIRINEIENEADDLYHIILSDLFENEKDAIELIKKKEIIQTMERAADRIEDVADVLKTIVIKVA
jgi:predicted phosphate transport protein (TIGR00153 family)